MNDRHLNSLRGSLIPLVFVCHGLLGVAAASAVTRDEAINHVIATVINTSSVKAILEGYALQDSIPAGITITQNGAETVLVPPVDSWLIWLDLRPLGKFAHPTRFVLVNTSGVVPTIVGIADGDLWPEINGVYYYEEQSDRDTTPDKFWSDGAVVPKPGTASSRQGKLQPQQGGRPQEWRHFGGDPNSPRTAAGTWGIVVSPYDSTGNYLGADIQCALETMDSLGVAAVTTAYKKNKAQTLAALDALPDNCSKLYVYWTGHGKPDQLLLPGGESITAKEFACKIKEQKADEYCVIVDACYSGSLLDEMADKGVNGFHMTSTSDTTTCTGFNGSPFTGSIFSTNLWDCIQGGLEGINALQWADSLVQSLKDSLVASADSTKWKPYWSGDYENDDHPQGGYVHTFGAAGTGPSGAGEPFCFQIARKCSTVCALFPGLAGSDTCANFTLSCEVNNGTGKKWIKKSSYNWNKGKSIYWRTYGVPGATGNYKITMHSNKGGVNVGVTWLPTTTTPETTPNSFVYNAGSVGWIDGDDAEFNPNLGQGTNGFYSYNWSDGLPYEQIPAHTGPEWFNQLQIFWPIEVDLARLELYGGGDPLQGFADNTVLILQAANLIDPLSELDVADAQYTVQAFQEGAGIIYGPFNGQFQRASVPSKPGTSGSMLPPAILPEFIDLGVILPEPVIVDISVLGPGVVVWDAIMMVNGGSLTPSSVGLPNGTIHLRLTQNYPNPFNPLTTIRYDLSSRGNVSLDVYDVRGQLVRTLVSGERDPGPYSIVWDGRTNLGAQVSSGIYFYRLSMAGDSRTRKMTVIR